MEHYDLSNLLARAIRDNTHEIRSLIYVCKHYTNVLFSSCIGMRMEHVEHCVSR